MNRTRSGLTGIVVLTATAFMGVPGARGADPGLVSKIEQLMEARAREGPFSGAVLVARDGEVIFRRGYGMANIEHDVPNTPETKFRLGSLTKQFTAAAILILQERGKLDVREKVKAYLPDSPEAWDAITVHHLLTHTSGIPNYTSQEGYLGSMRQPTTPRALVARFQDRPLDFTPGERFAYSNSGYAVLGLIIEKVSGEPYAEFLREAIFKPLAMDDSGYDAAAPVLKHRASGYSRLVFRTVNAMFVDMSVPYAAGALYSTVDDLWKWDRGLAAGQVLSKDSLNAMFTPALNRYGYGWSIVRAHGRTMETHAGGINGFATDIRRFPDDQACIIVLSNVEGTPVSKIGGNLAAALFGKGARPTDDPGAKAGTPAAEKPGEPAPRP